MINSRYSNPYVNQNRRTLFLPCLRGYYLFRLIKKHKFNFDMAAILHARGYLNYNRIFSFKYFFFFRLNWNSCVEKKKKYAWNTFWIRSIVPLRYIEKQIYISVHYEKLMFIRSVVTSCLYFYYDINNKFSTVIYWTFNYIFTI